MKYLIRKVGMLAIALCLQMVVYAQDAHFSQYYSSPHLVNPAFAALFQGDYQVMVNYRSQWDAVMDNPYRTISVAGDMKILPFKNRCDYFGVGLNMLADQAGSLNYSTYQGNLAFSFFKNLDGAGRTFLASGFSVGLGQRGLDYDPTAFLDGPETLGRENFSYTDFSGGLIFVTSLDANNYFYGGAAVHHLNRPEMSFFGTNSLSGTSGQTDPLARKYVTHAGASFATGGKVLLKPSFHFAYQGKQFQANFGSFVQYMAGHALSKQRNAFYLGAFYRWNDALSLATRLDIKDYYLTVSYDFTVSRLREASSATGGLEMSFAKAIFRKQAPSCPDPLSCPKF